MSLEKIILGFCLNCQPELKKLKQHANQAGFESLAVFSSVLNILELLAGQKSTQDSFLTNALQKIKQLLSQVQKQIPVNEVLNSRDQKSLYWQLKNDILDQILTVIDEEIIAIEDSHEKSEGCKLKVLMAIRKTLVEQKKVMPIHKKSDDEDKKNEVKSTKSQVS